MKNIVKYSDEDILYIAEKIYSQYEVIFLGKKVPKLAISSLARLLEKYPQEEDRKMLTLEYAARIKYEIQNAFDHIDFKLDREDKNFVYNKSSFAVRQATKDVYGYGEDEELPETIKSCVDDAYFCIINEDEYDEDDALNLKLK